MGLVPALTSFSNGTTADATQVNANYTSIRDTFNTYAVLTDTAKTISVAHTWSIAQTWSAAQTFPGITSSSASIFTTVTATRLDVSSSAAILVLNESDQSLNNKKWRFFADSQVFSLQVWDDAESTTANVFSVTRSGATVTGITLYPAITTTSAMTVGSLIVNTSGITVNTGTTAVQALTATTGTFSGNINSQTISATANFTGTVAVATGLTVSGGGITVTGNSTIAGTLGSLTGITTSGGVTVSSGGVTVTGNSTINGTLGSLTGLTLASGNLTFGAASAKIISGATSIVVRDNADANTLLTITQATGDVQVQKAGSIFNCNLFQSIGLHTVKDSSAIKILEGDPAAAPGNVWIGNQSANATTATTKMLILSGCAGTPTGSFALGGNGFPVVVDSTNFKLYINFNGTWKSVTLT